MCETTLLNQISLEYQNILGRRLVGIYVHGSLAFGCYRRERSDIDFLAVTRDPPAPAEKEALIDALLKLENDWPAKGIEMSVVLKKYCANFVYPTPFELHFSKMYTERCRQDRKLFCRAMHGTDRDLAAHFTVTRAVGITLCGESAASVFGAVSPEYYLDSIRADLRESGGGAGADIVSYLLNLCRVLAAQEGGLILSKEQGGRWGAGQLPRAYTSVIEAALACYQCGAPFQMEASRVKEFSGYMLGRIFG